MFRCCLVSLAFWVALPIRAQLTATDNRLWHQDSPGVMEAAEESDFFGSDLTVGDFNGDGFVDLAVAAANEDLAGVEDAGVVQVIYGGSGGLSPDLPEDQLLALGVEGLPGDAEVDSLMGFCGLAAGDFNADSRSDLVVGNCIDDVDGLINAGSVLVVPGAPFGLDTGSALLISGQTDLPIPAQAGDNLGAGLAVGDFDGDGFDDLAFGILAEIDGAGAAGAVEVLYGSTEGLTFDGVQLFHQGVVGIPGDPEGNDRFGTALAALDFDGDGFDDLAIGAPRDNIDGIDAGSVTVLKGTGVGLTRLGAQFLVKGQGGIDGTPEDSNLFGSDLTGGDFDGDGRDDLVIVDIHHTVGGQADAGAAWLLQGSAEGLEPQGRIEQGSAPAGGQPGADEDFGGGRTSGDFDADGFDDLALASLEQPGGTFRGEVTVLYGGPVPFPEHRTQHFDLANSGLAAGNEESLFGVDLATGDIDGNGVDDLVVGDNLLTVSGNADAGAVAILTSDDAVTCVESPTARCLLGHRFRVEVDFTTAMQAMGEGQVVPEGSDDSGLFWFFAPDNWELLVKVLDGCGVNDRFWVFVAATTAVEYSLTVTDTATGETRQYDNPPGAAQAIADTAAFATCSAEAAKALPDAVASGPVLPVGGAGDDCGGGVLCLQETRFQLTIDWEAPGGVTGEGTVVPVSSDDSGLFWFFEPDNWEVLIKVLDGCALNGHYWVFSAATTNVGYSIHVADTKAGESRTYENGVGVLARAITDTGAFATCP